MVTIRCDADCPILPEGHLHQLQIRLCRYDHHRLLNSPSEVKALLVHQLALLEGDLLELSWWLAQLAHQSTASSSVTHCIDLMKPSTHLLR